MSNFEDIDKIFREKCSAKTIQSNEHGFFTSFCFTVINSFKSDQEFQDWLKNYFAKCESDYEKIQFLYNDPTVSWEILGTLEHVAEVFRKKDSMFSWQKREQVLKLVKAYDEGRGQVPLDKVLILASQAVMRAPMKDDDRDIDNGLTLALALLQRAEVFYRMNNGVYALKDLQLAVKCGLPVKTNAEYYAKLSKVYALINEDKKADISINLYHKLIADDFRRDVLIREVDALKSKIKSGDIKPFQDSQKRLPPLKEHPSKSSKLERCTSTCIKLQESPDAGRYFVANGEIQVGETVLVEKALGACLYPKNFGTHCYHCFVRLIAPIGCTSCASIAFCSVECRDAALSTYHKFECKYLDLLIGSGMSILCHIALRIIMKQGTPEKALEEGENVKKIFCSHDSMRNLEDFFRRCLMSTFLLRVLQKSEFFGRRTTESAEPTPNEMKIGGLIFAYLQSLQFNAHEIYEKLTTGHLFSKSKLNYIGVGIYEVGAMFNHECYPSITRYFSGDTLILNTIRPHADNEVVAENYGPIFTKMSLKERQRSLASRYWFKCACKPCKENWPVYERMSNKSRIKCSTDGCDGFLPYPQDRNKNVKCPKCKNVVSLQVQMGFIDEAENQFYDAAEAMEAEDVSKAIYCLKSGIESFHKGALPPHKDLHIAEESFSACIGTNGNIFSIKDQ
ncbi:unnamed protein product [Chironomus riparius]|uniref:MYND-type domain-containing protein n=1 Tax=Chironomus riparius TaxID=315576 RepID=A0A9N9S709_9DIPT|nr:unnamed protein product [Chironomus riparius]